MPAGFQQIINRALSANVENRFPSTREMARQIGTALKKVQLRKDLHTILARTVVEARQHLGMDAVVNERSDATPIAELTGDITPRIEMPVEEKGKSQVGEKLRGLRHYLPFFGRKRG